MAIGSCCGSRQPRPWLVLWAFLLLAAINGSCGSLQKGASISVRSRWQGTPYLLEAAEFLADEADHLFWEFINSIDLGSSESSGPHCWQSITQHVFRLVPEQVAQILPLVLGVRQYSAKLETFRQLSLQLHPDVNGSCCYVDFEGTIVDGAAGLQEQLKKLQTSNTRAGNSTVQLVEVDHVFNPTAQHSGAAHAILYGPPGSTCWNQLHGAITDYLKQPGQGHAFVYAARPVLFEACQVHPCLKLGSEEQLVLPGYGVEAVLKNMEYSAVDDKARAAAAEAAKKVLQNSQAGSGADEELGEVKGFKFDVLVARKPNLRQELLTFRDTLSAADDDKALKVWDLKDAGLQATTRVAQASNPLHLLMDISQNFPSIVSSLTKQPVSSKLRKQVSATQELVNAGSNFMMLNGLMVEINNFELYSFVERLRIELRLQAVFESLKIPKALALNLLQKRVHDTSDSLQELRLDLSPVTKVLWLNNFEKDKAYKHLSSSLYDLLNVYPGRVRPIARNVFNFVAITEPLTTTGLAVAQLFWSSWTNKGPMRTGLLPVVPSVVDRLLEQQAHPGVIVETPSWEDMSLEEQFMRGFLTLKSAFGPLHAFKYWKSLESSVVEKGSDALLQSFQEAWASAAKGSKDSFASAKRAARAANVTPSQAADDLKEGTKFSSEAGMQLQELCSYMLRKGVAYVPKPLLWFNGIVQPMPEGGTNSLDREIGQMLVWQHMPMVQEAVYYNQVPNEGNVLSNLLEQYQTVSSWNPRLLGSDEDTDAQKISLAALPRQPGYKSIPFLHSKGSGDKIKSVTHLVITDLSHARGRSLALAAMEYLMDSDFDNADDGRIGLVLAPSAGVSALDGAVQALCQAYSSNPAVLKLIKSVISNQKKLAEVQAASVGKEELESLLALIQEAELQEPDLAVLTADKLPEAATTVELFKQMSRDVFGLQPGMTAVISNGRMLVDYDPSAGNSTTPALTAADFDLMQIYGSGFQPGAEIAAAVKRDAGSLQPEEMNNVVMITASAFGAQVYPDSRFGAMNEAKQLGKVLKTLKETAASAGTTEGDADLQILAIMNPLTRVAQRTSQVLSWVSELLSPDVRLYLNPVKELTDMPLKSYYRYALPQFTRDADGKVQMPGNPTAYFPRLPPKRVLTLNLETPESWLVEPVMALHDLDNLLLDSIPERVAYAEYELEAIMLTGSCLEKIPNNKRMTTPRGLQLHLGTTTQPHLVDTLVMSNMGYFQLKASPGLWQLSIAPGRSRELYKMLSSAVQGGLQSGWTGVRDAGGAETLTDNSTQILLSSFLGKHIVLKVQKRSGKEDMSLLFEKKEGSTEEVLEEDAALEEDTGMWQSLKGALGVKGPNKTATNTTINVMTVASGHMYERLQKIMILSVIKNTKSRVKFWIIKNYMSPHHKRIIPAMAKQYGFDYEFVTYKWPHWLHKQTDKQRIIWAYKILFLDVLFPLDVPRMIFVDSDQVVRTDLAELYNMDLKGAPMAYTPFCDNNKEMDEFRFWNGGFWLNHLRGKPYHISALYLIDLKRFRQVAAGDNYRVMYEQLSKDPNSLANLDQDLPNYAQHQIPIFSLSQEWLWCESWCGNETKAKAKTIDLCNNPKTKEPKLVAARRIIGEWPAFDEEQANFTARVDAQFAAQEAAFAETGDAASSTSSNGDPTIYWPATEQGSHGSGVAVGLPQSFGEPSAEADGAAHDEL